MPTPVKLTIKFKADTLEEFVERYGVYVSQGGIFVRTKKPLSVGALVDFEFKLQAGDALLTGQGTVVWTREHDPARRGAPAGMGLRYDHLDEESVTVLTRILALKGTEAPEAEQPPEAVTSPGNQEEKTKVASLDVLNRLRESADEGAGEPVEKKNLFDLDGPVDLDSGPLAADSGLNLEKPMEDEPEPPASDGKSPMDEGDTPLPQVAAPLLPMSEIREPFEQKATLRTDEEKAPEDADVLSELKAMASAKTEEKTEGKTEEKTEGEITGDPETEEAKESPKDDKDLERELFDQIDEALKTGSDKPGAREPARRAKAHGEVWTEEEPKKGSTGLWLLFFLLLAALIGGGVYYWKVILPGRQEAKEQTSEPAPRKDVPSKPTEPVTRDATPSETPQPTGDATPAETPQPTEDATPAGKKPVDEPAGDEGGDMKPLVVDPPEKAPVKTCGEDEHAVEVTSTPSGVSLVINLEKQQEKTPATFCLKGNRGYTIGFEHDDFLPATEFIPRLTKKTEVHKQMATYPHRILVQTDPRGAVVTIDGERIGNSTVSKTYEKAQELWKVEIQMPGYRSETIEVKLDDSRWSTRTRVKSYDIFRKLQKQ